MIEKIPFLREACDESSSRTFIEVGREGNSGLEDRALESGQEIVWQTHAKNRPVTSKQRRRLVAMFAPNLAGGGAERVLVNLACELSERGYLVDVVLSSATGVLRSELPSAVRVVDLKSPKVSMSVPALSRYLRERRPHSLLAFLERSNIAATWAAAIARSNTRVITTVHAMWPISGLAEGSWKTRLVQYLARSAHKRAAAIIAVSNGAADSLAAMAGISRARISVIYNPVITPSFLRRASECYHHQWVEIGEPPLIVGMGSLSHLKDFPTLLRAFVKVRGELPCRLMIIGEGERRKEIEGLIRELRVGQDVILPGFMMNPYPCLRRASLFVLSSRQEGLGNVLIEALALGVPCVATDCGGPSEILGGGRYGHLTPVGDVDAMAAAILSTLRGLHTTVPDIAWRPFTLSTAVDAYEDILTQV